MSTSLPQPFPAPSVPFETTASLPQQVTSTVFDNGVEADLHPTISKRPRVSCDDRELLSACTRALSDALKVPKGRVMASVRDGTVVLEGRTSFYYERAAAEGAVHFLDGVNRIENHIVVESPALAHDVRVCIAGALLRTAVDEATHIAVHAVGGTVILQGVVHSRAERDMAERAAWTVEGVHAVIDNLIIST